MNIGFDAKRAAQNATGLGNYSRFVLEMLLKHAPDLQLYLYMPSQRKARLLQRLPKSDRLHFCYPTTKWQRLFSGLWRIVGLNDALQQDGISLYHGLSNELPLNIRRAKGVKTVVTIHDLLFLRFPEGYHAIDRLIYNFKFRRACRNADQIIAVSQFTKQEIVDRYQISSDKIAVVYQGCDKSFAQPVSEARLEEVRLAYDLPKRYILYVGSIEKRKNLMLLARAMKQVDASISVIAVGRRTPYADEVEAYLRSERLEGRMRLVSGVPFHHLPALYRQASVFVYPSRCEGFGIPLLEAISSGVPAIGCTGSCLEEAGGPGSVYVDPDDEEALAREINRIVLGDDHSRRQMIESGREYAQRFDEESLCRDLMDVYRRLIPTI